YRAEAQVNWCPGCMTVLANEQVLPDGTCERSGDLVVRRTLEQWFFKITEYAEELLDSLGPLEWPERVKAMQRNWIGRSEGVEFDLPLAYDSSKVLRVFTTRPDTGFGVTYAVVAPEHPLLDTLTTDDERARVNEVVLRASNTTEIERSTTSSEGIGLEKRGAFTGSFVINPFTNEQVPVYVADYVLGSYGTGAIMAVPGEDERDFEFAKVHGLSVVRTVQPPAGFDGDAYTGDGEHVNSGFLDGLDVANAKTKAAKFLEANAHGVRKVNYRLRDWLVSRQRFWGCPIPVVYCDDHGIVPVPEDQLPVLAPDDVVIDKTGQSPLATHEGFLNTTCPICGKPARRETDTMDTFTDSSWYYLRFADPFTQGMIRFHGSKMSKSKGNLVTPEAYYQTVGADGLRLFHLFAGPPGDNLDWTDQTDDVIDGCGRFIDRFYRLWHYRDVHFHDVADETDYSVRQVTHRTIARVTSDLNRWSYNTAVAAIMELLNAASKVARSKEGIEKTTLDESLDTMAMLLAPMTPHLTAELWQERHPEGPSVHLLAWPVADPALVVEAAVTMVVQVNGRVKVRLS